MRKLLPGLAITVALATVMASSTPAGAAVVGLTVESSTAPAPLFDGTVETLPHEVDGGDGSGQHPCEGPPAQAPAPTATGALDDALRGAGISWRGNWDPSIRDFFVDRIGLYASASPDRYWSLSVNGGFSAGGCLTRVADGDAIRFYYGPLFGAPPDSDGEAGPPAGGQPGEGARGKGAPGGGGSSRKPTRRVAAAASRYLRRSRGAGEAWARLALELRRGADPAKAAADLLAGRLGRQRRDGSVGGDVNATAIAVLALEARQPRRAGRAVAWLTGAQSPDGGFGFRPGAAADVDTTATATWALAVARRRAAALQGASFVRGAQSADGGFPAIPGGASNSQSTGLATVALRVAGLGARLTSGGAGPSPLDYLASLSRHDGSIAYDDHISPTPVWTTAQALLGLTTKEKLMQVDTLRTEDDRTTHGRENGRP